MIHPELKAHCDRFIALNDRMEELREELDRIKRKDTWYKAIILLFGLLMFVVGFVGVLDEGLNVENATALALGIPALYIVRRAEKAKERILNEYEQLHLKSELLDRKLQSAHSRLRYEKEEKLRGNMMLVDWDGRPAISFSAVSAYAILEPEGSWVEVDAADVSNSGKVISDKPSFHATFSDQYHKAIIADAVSLAVNADTNLDWVTYYEKHSVSAKKII